MIFDNSFISFGGSTIMNIYDYVPDELINSLIDRDWLVAPFKAQGIDLYNSANYLHNVEIEKINYIIYLDLNIFSYILSSLNKSNKDTKDAISLVIFCQFCKILFEPGLALHEKINYRDEIPDSIIDELNLFRGIENTQPESLIQYALGQTTTFNLNTSNFIEDRSYYKREFSRYRRLTDWDSFYLYVLKLVHLDKENSKGTQAKLFDFIDWMHSEFMHSVIATVFALYLFSPERKKNMLKYKSNDLKENKKKQLDNMTWDIYLMDRFYRLRDGKNSNKEFLLASNDNVLKEVLVAVIRIQTDTGMDYLRQNHPDWQIYFQKINHLSDTGRVFGSENLTQEYRNELIERYENLLL